MNRQQTFMELVSLHQSQVFGYIYALLRDLNESEDVYQQTCLILWRKFDQYDPSVKFSTWACGVARREVLSHLRRQGRRPLDFSEQFLRDLPDDLPETDSPTDDRRRALSKCLAALAEDDRRLVDLRYLEGLAAGDVAEQVGRPVQGIYNSLSRIRRALHDCIERRIAQEQSP